MSALTWRLATTLPALAVAAALVACQPARPGAAAIVERERIAVDQVQQAVDRVLAMQLGGANVDGGEVARAQLTRLINSRILARAATNLGISVTPGEIDARLGAYRQRFGGQRELEQEAQRAGVAPGELREFVRDLVLADKVGDRLVQGASVTQVRAAHILVKDKATADRLLAQVRSNPASFVALAKRYSLDTSNRDTGGDLGFQSPARYVKPFAEALATARPGQFLTVQTEFGWHVVQVVASRTLRSGQLPPAEARQAFEDERTARVAGQLRETARDLDITVNPRYGRWDAQALAVVAPEDRLSKPAGGQEERAR